MHNTAAHKIHLRLVTLPEINCHSRATQYEPLFSVRLKIVCCVTSFGGVATSFTSKII